jgi:sec-independent protein translocase protein TatB
MSFFGMGAWEITIILVAALVIFGPDRLPEMAGKVGKQIRDLRQMSSDLTGEFERSAGVQEFKSAVQGEIAGVKSQVDSVTSSVKRDLDKAGSKVSSTTKAATTSSTSKVTSTTAAKSTTSSTTKTAAGKTTSTAKKEQPKATKKDPLADLGFFEESTSTNKPAATSKPAPTTSTLQSPAATTGGAPTSSSDQVDALTRARQRRQAAGYNRPSA